MPFDSRRITGPEITHSIEDFIKTLPSGPLVNGRQKRLDGRGLEDLRPICIKTGVVNQAKGSAYVEMQQTKIICAIYGPREMLRKHEVSPNGLVYCELKFCPFSCVKRRQHQQDGEEKSMSLALQQALEPAIRLDQFPKARLDVFVSVLENGGSVLATSITCAGLALADCGIAMYDLIIGCSLRQVGSHALLDPSAVEETSQVDDAYNGVVTLAYMPTKQQITALGQFGKLESHTLNKAIKTLMEGCHRIYPVVRRCLEQKFLKQASDKALPNG